MKLLNEILEKKGVEYAHFDPTRFPRIFQKIEKKIKSPQILQIIGTNGKGTTGRFIGNFFHKRGFNVAHFTSPHIKKVNERFWKNGDLLDDSSLEKGVVFLQDLLEEEDFIQLSYFEFLTLLAVTLFQDVDFLILEAGLGGEFDSTTALPITLQIFTKIGMDHHELLGESIKEIAKTKCKAIKSDCIVALQEEKIVETIAEKIAIERSHKITFARDFDGALQSFLKEDEPHFLGENRLSAFLTLKKLGFTLVPEELLFEPIFGRLTKFRENIFLDVGHNLSAAKEIRKYFQDKKVIIIYNSYREKEYSSIVNELKDIAKQFLHIPIENERIIEKKEIEQVLHSFGFDYQKFNGINPKEVYLVFGSFLCVEEFLKI